MAPFSRKGLLLAIALMSGTVTAAAQGRCKVFDPTGTPLNARATPNGAIIGTLPNDLMVTVLDTANSRGRPWALVAQFESGCRIGWVFREFITCY